MKHISESLAKIISRWPEEKRDRLKKEMEKIQREATKAYLQ